MNTLNTQPTFAGRFPKSLYSNLKKGLTFENNKIPGVNCTISRLPGRDVLIIHSDKYTRELPINEDISYKTFSDMFFGTINKMYSTQKRCLNQSVKREAFKARVK